MHMLPFGSRPFRLGGSGSSEGEGLLLCLLFPPLTQQGKLFEDAVWGLLIRFCFVGWLELELGWCFTNRGLGLLPSFRALLHFNCC